MRIGATKVTTDLLDTSCFPCDATSSLICERLKKVIIVSTTELFKGEIHNQKTR